MKPKTIKFTLIGLLILSTIFTSHTQAVHAQTDRIVFAVIGDYGIAGQPLLDVSNLIKSWN
ncbi:MAG: hypothetical protein ACKOBL_23080, partial [Chloroflexota bacterium]